MDSEQAKSRRDKDFTRSTKVKGSFKDLKRTKLRSESASIADAKRRPFGGFEFEEAQERKCLQERRRD
jgi:hypothetical protein